MGSKCFASLKTKNEDNDIMPLIIKNLNSSFDSCKKEAKQTQTHENPPYDPSPTLISIDSCDACLQEGPIVSNLDDHL